MLPREGGCQDASYNAWELRATRRVLLTKALAEQFDHSSMRTHHQALGSPTQRIRSGDAASAAPRVIVLHRTMSPYSQNLFDVKRRWSRGTLENILHNIRLKLPTAEVNVFSDGNATLMSCISCQIRLFSSADIVIGVSNNTY
jgi:hypothetical protein